MKNNYVPKGVKKIRLITYKKKINDKRYIIVSDIKKELFTKEFLLIESINKDNHKDIIELLRNRKYWMMNISYNPYYKCLLSDFAISFLNEQNEICSERDAKRMIILNI